METFTVDPLSSLSQPIGHAVDSRLTPPSGRYQFTAADLARMPSELAQGTVKYELCDGELVTMAPPGHDHSRRQARIVTHLVAGAEDRGLGEAHAEVGVVLRRNPDRVVGPDAAFILAASLPARLSPEGYLETIPELVVEVRSPNDSNPEIAAKADEYFRAGVRVVWVIDPAARTVADRRPDSSVHIFREADTLTCDLLPGFGVPVARLFAGT